MKSHKTILASILAATLCAASPLLASATDHGSSGSSSSDSRPEPAPAPVERSAPAPAPVERSAPAPVERSAPAPVANAPLQGGGTQPLPRSPVRGPVQPLPRYAARAPDTQQDSNQWQWNDDVSWIGTNAYWGDGF